MTEQYSQLDSDCLAELEKQSKLPAECIRECMVEIETRYSQGNPASVWSLGSAESSPVSPVAGSTASAGEQQWTANQDLCRRCVENLRAEREPDHQVGWLENADIWAETFTCDGKIHWGNESKAQALTLNLGGMRFPAVCSEQDISSLFEDSHFSTGIQSNNFKGEATCDLFATLFDDSAPWWIFGVGIFWVICNVALSRTPSLRALKCMLWCYMTFDIAIGLCLVIYGFLVMSQSGMPVLMKILFPLFGAVQVLIGCIISLAMDTDDKFKTGVCACLACVAAAGGIVDQNSRLACLSAEANRGCCGSATFFRWHMAWSVCFSDSTCRLQGATQCRVKFKIIWTRMTRTK